MLKKLKLKNLNGNIYVDRFNKRDDYIWIYDEHKNYLDSISTEYLDRTEYKKWCESLKNSHDIEDFIENHLMWKSYEYDTNLFFLIYKIYETSSEETYNNVLLDYSHLVLFEFLEKYDIERIGDYFIHCDY